MQDSPSSPSQRFVETFSNPWLRNLVVLAALGTAWAAGPGYAQDPSHLPAPPGRVEALRQLALEVRASDQDVTMPPAWHHELHRGLGLLRQLHLRGAAATDFLSAPRLQALYAPQVSSAARLRFVRSAGRVACAIPPSPQKRDATLRGVDALQGGKALKDMASFDGLGPPCDAEDDGPCEPQAPDDGALLRQGLCSLEHWRAASSLLPPAVLVYQRQGLPDGLEWSDVLLQLPLHPGTQPAEVLRGLLALRLQRGTLHPGELCIRVPSDGSVDALRSLLAREPARASQGGALARVVVGPPGASYFPTLRGFFASTLDVGDIYTVTGRDYFERVRLDYDDSVHLRSGFPHHAARIPYGVPKPTLPVLLVQADEGVASHSKIPLGTPVLQAAALAADGHDLVTTLTPQALRAGRPGLKVFASPPPFPYTQTGFTSYLGGFPVAEHVLEVALGEQSPQAGVLPAGLSFNRPHGLLVAGYKHSDEPGLFDAVAVFPDGSLMALPAYLTSQQEAETAAYHQAENEGTLERRLHYRPVNQASPSGF